MSSYWWFSNKWVNQGINACDNDKDYDDDDDFDVEDDGISLDISIQNLQQILTYLGRNNLKHACTHILANAIQTKTRILMNI